MLGPFGEFEKAVRRDAEGRARQLRDHGTAARGQDDASGRNDTFAHLHRVRRRNPRVAHQQIDVPALEVALIEVVEPEDEGLAGGLEPSPVVAADGKLEAIVDGVLQRVPEVAGVPHDFLRYAAHVDAGASQAVHFDQQRSGAVFGRALRAGQPAAAPADHDQIIVKRHAIFSWDVNPVTLAMLHRPLGAKMAVLRD